MDHPHQRDDLDDDDTGDSLDGLVLSVVDSLGEDHNGRLARPTSAPPVEGNSLSQTLFLGERQRTDSISEFLTKSPGQMLGGLRKRPQQPNGQQQQQQSTLSTGLSEIDDVLTSFPQMSLSSPTSPLGNNAVSRRFDFLDLPQTSHFSTTASSNGGMQTAIPPRAASADVSHHHRSLSQGNYGSFPLGPTLLAGIAGSTVSQSSSTPHSSPPVSEVGDALEDRATDEALLQQQIEELQRQLRMKQQSNQVVSAAASAGVMGLPQPQMQPNPHSREWGAGVPFTRSQSTGPNVSSMMGAGNSNYAPVYSNANAMNVLGNAGSGSRFVAPNHERMSNNGYMTGMEASAPGDYRGLVSQVQAGSYMPHGAHKQQQQPQQQQQQQQSVQMNKMVSPTRQTMGPSLINSTFSAAQRQEQQLQQQQHALTMQAQYMNGPGAFVQEKLPADAPLEHLQGRFLQLAQEQNGCRYLQQRIAREGPSGAGLVLREVFPHLVQLMMDPFANYMYQKLLEHAAPEQRLRMLEAVQRSLLVASLNLHGTRSVQKHIEVGGREPRQRDLIAHELAPYVTKLSMDTNGNHVVQRMLQHLDHCEFVCDAIIQDLLIVTRHRHGCCVVQRSLDAADSPHRAALIKRIEESALQLMQDPFANYTVQYVIENGRPGEGLRIVELIRGKIEQLSKQKFSSNVVERCMIAAPPHVLQQFVDEAIGCMGELLHDAFANFVAQKLLDPITTDLQARAVVSAMRPHLLDLNPSCSRRVANKIIKRFPDMVTDDVVQKVLGGGGPTAISVGSGPSGGVVAVMPPPPPAAYRVAAPHQQQQQGPMAQMSVMHQHMAALGQQPPPPHQQHLHAMTSYQQVAPPPLQQVQQQGRHHHHHNNHHHQHHQNSHHQHNHHHLAPQLHQHGMAAQMPAHQGQVYGMIHVPGGGVGAAQPPMM